MQTVEKTVQHCWKPMKEFQVSGEDFIDSIEGDTKDIVEIMKKMQPNQFYVACTMNAAINGTDLMNPSRFHKYIESLREKGLDIGDGNHEYGYSMPIPKKKDITRELIIFRRHL